MLFIDMLPQLLGDVPGCPDITATNALLNASIEFLGHTRAWNQTLTPFPLVDMQSGYAIVPPTDARTVAVMSVRNPYRPMVAKTQDQLDRESPHWPAQLSSAPLFYNVSPDTSTLNVFPTPMSAMSALITIRAAFAPTLTALEIPDYIANDNFESLLDGARAKLMLMAKRSWSDMQLGAYFKTQFENAKVMTRIKVIHENSDSTLVVSAPPFGF